MADQTGGATRLQTSITTGVPGPGDPFLLGVNYWPRRKAMYFWTQFDPGEVRDEFALIKDVGIRVVRFFLRWEDFQPEADRIDPRQIRNLEAVAQTASDVGVLLEPTLFNGHMSGPNWSPAWLLSDQPAVPGDRPLIVGGRVVDRRVRNVYVDPFAIAAEERIVRAAAGALSGHPAVWAWSLGNEPDLFCRPPTAEDGAAWTARITNLIHEIDPAHPVTIGLHTASIENQVGLRVDQLAEGTDFSVMHGYSIYAGWAKEPLDSDVVPYANALTAALAGRPVLFEEYGLCTAQPGQPSHYEAYPVQGRGQYRQFFPSEEDGARYYEQVLQKLVKVGALGAFGWCFADYIPELWDRPPCDQFIHERFFGFVRPDGSLKPHAEVIRRFAQSKPIVQAPEVEVKLDVSADEYYQEPSTHLRRLFKGFGVP